MGEEERVMFPDGHELNVMFVLTVLVHHYELLRAQKGFTKL